MLRHIASTVLLIVGLGSVTAASKAAIPAASSEPVPSAPLPTAAPIVSCEARIEGLGLSAPTERFERYLEALPEVIVQTRVVGALYLTWPSNPSPARARLEASTQPNRALRALVAGGDRAQLREIVLSDGYLFAERPALARALSASVGLPELFDAPAIHRLRDGRIERLVREGGVYRGGDGRIATLRLNDRVAVEATDLEAPLHLDLEVIRRRTGALRTSPIAMGSNAAALELAFPDGTHRLALARLDNGATEVSCVGGDRETLERTLAHAAHFATRHERIVAAARALVRERPRFDEPVNEPEGVQEDGRLRAEWLSAYLQGERTFTYRDIAYPVFDAEGNARPPQVCVDFVFDSWERAEGTWYRRRDEAPGRTEGSIRFRGVPRRSIQQLLSYGREEGHDLERVDIGRRDRVALREGRGFARAMARIADDVRQGDALIIHGLRLQDMRNHYHAVLVLDVEPMTGVPMTVADNQGRPRLRTLTSAMRAAPLRSINHRIRVDFEAMEQP